MEYKVVITEDAEADLDGYISYLLFEKKSRQAAKNVLDDFEATIINLAKAAGSLKLCDNPRLREKGYRRINFLSHRYFMLYRIEEDVVIVDSIFHELQDYENKVY
ncbi:MAG: type II toxin-antitoxin system RelE/ParE family toxin [Lachnospiraceae bacterium]|nr:type II toxin-antitoxin system RelE/ParE family toxin [Lachnospiraceae bacterium]